MDRVFFLLLLWTAVTVVAAKFDCNIEETTIQNTTDATVAVPVCVDDVPIPRVPLLSPPPPPIPSPTSPGHVCGRIFQIGFNKCGTVSLSRFFAENGVPAVHYDLGRLGRTMHKRYLQGKPLIDETIYSQFLFLSDFEYFDVATRVSKPIYARLYGLSVSFNPLHRNILQAPRNYGANSTNSIPTHYLSSTYETGDIGFRVDSITATHRGGTWNMTI